MSGGDAVSVGLVGTREETAGDLLGAVAHHEAAHVVQQRRGVSLPGGVGQEHDPHEQHADTVADTVVAGRSAAALLDESRGFGNATFRV